MKHKVVLAALLAVSSFVGVASAKAPAGDAAPAAASAGKKTERHGKFPMAAAEFRTKSSERLAKAREKMEDHIKVKKVPSEKAQIMRARFDEVATKVNAAVAKVTADGSVTKDEAKEVQKAAEKARKEARAHKSEKDGKADKGAKADPKKPEGKVDPKKVEPKKGEPKKPEAVDPTPSKEQEAP